MGKLAFRKGDSLLTYLHAAKFGAIPNKRVKAFKRVKGSVKTIISQLTEPMNFFLDSTFHTKLYSKTLRAKLDTNKTKQSAILVKNA